jgi:hypothetical protein
VPAPDAALAYDLRQRALSLATWRAVERLWARIGPREDWARAWDVDAATRTLVTGQLAAARDAETYLGQVLPQVGLPDEPVGALQPEAFAGVASDGRDLAGLLEQPLIRARTAGGGLEGLEAGAAQLRMIVMTQVADAAREAVQAGIVARPGVGGYVRMLAGKSCPRCVILAGRWYRWSAGFRRHPHCDCRHIPAAEDRAEDWTTDPRRALAAGQVRGLTRDQLRAIGDGADLGQVVNASRGTSTAVVGGRVVRVTTEGTTRAGYASYVRRAIARERGTAAAETATRVGRRGAVQDYVVRRTAPRLMPGEIYRVAESREDAIRLLISNGYVMPSAVGQSTIHGLAATVA